MWKLRKPTGSGGPWFNTQLKANDPSEPYLIGFYNKRTLKISNKVTTKVTFTIQADPVGTGEWMVYQQVKVKPGETFEYLFPETFQSRWIRFVANSDCISSTVLTYN